MEDQKARTHDYFPTALTASEIADPIKVIDDFFDDDNFINQLERLKFWRDATFSDAPFHGDNGSISSLLYFHQLSVKLVEAFYVLKDKEDLDLDIETNAEDENSVDRNTALGILMLTDITDPGQLIRRLFEQRQVASFKYSLYQWLENGMSDHGASAESETADVISLYEALQQLFALAWLIKNQSMKESDNNEDHAQRLSYDRNAIHADDLSVYKLTDHLRAHSDVFQELIVLIRTAFPTVSAIYYLGDVPERYRQCFFYILVNEKEDRKAQALANEIENLCEPVCSIIALVHGQWHMTSGLDKQDLFLSNAMNSPLLYLSGDLIIPQPPVINALAVSEKAACKWGRWYQQGKEFLDGADFFYEREAFSTSLFCLQQASESFLIGIIKAVAGYKINTHNLSRLLTLTELFTRNITGIFYDVDKQLFEDLKNAYIVVRYKDTHDIDKAKIELLIPLVNRLEQTVKLLFEKHYLRNGI